MIGGNAVGDLVMWKDPKKSAGVLFGILIVLYIFYSSGTTLRSALTSKLMFAFIAIFMHS
jgi:uncharacterized membrane protein YedE/YeeE